MRFDQEFLEISEGLFGVSKAAARLTVQAADKTEPFEAYERGRAQLFLRYCSSGEDLHAILIIAVFEGFELTIVHGLKIYPSIGEDFFSLGPQQLLERVIRRFGALPFEHPTTQTLLRTKLGYALTTEYVDWIAAQGRDMLLEEQIRLLTKFAAERVVPDVQHIEFADAVFRAVHDYCYYARQHSRAMSSLSEEQIRDLFLVLVKCLFGFGGGETFRYDGRVDFEIRNPRNQYETVTGEFKKWKGPSTARAVFHQAVRKHSTGQELEIYALFISDRKDAASVLRQVRKTFATERESIENSLVDKTLPGSHETFGQMIVGTRVRRVPLCFGILDTYHSPE